QRSRDLRSRYVRARGRALRSRPGAAAPGHATGPREAARAACRRVAAPPRRCTRGPPPPRRQRRCPSRSARRSKRRGQVALLTVVSFYDAEIGKLTREATPAGLDLVDAGGARALLGPAVELPDAELLAFGEELHGPVGAILDPARKPQPTCFSLGRGPEVDAMDPAAD